MGSEEEQPQQSEPQIVQEKPKKQKVKKKKSIGKSKRPRLSFKENLIAHTTKWFKGPTGYFLSKLPDLNENIKKSNLSMTGEALISLALFITFLTIPILVGIDFLLYYFFPTLLGSLTILVILLLSVVPLMVFPITISLTKISQGNRSQAIEPELPYLIGYISVLAGGGISPITIIKRISSAGKLFPASSKEAKRILLDVEVFGMNAVSAMEKASRYNPNKVFSDFIGGYISVLKTGGDAISYLESKLKDIFAYRAQRVRAAAELVGTMAEAYITATVVMGISFFVLFAVQSTSGGGGNASSGSSSVMLFSVVFVPVISVIFLFVMNSLQAREPFTYMKPYYYFLGGCAVIPVFVFLPLGLPLYTQLAIGLIISTIPATMVERRYMSQKAAVEAKLPSFLRDISEVKKTGLAPEKTIEQLAERNYSKLTPFVQNMSAQLSWGVNMRDVMQNFASKVHSWIAKAVAFLLLEVVDVGGGTSRMFINLADFTEKNNQIEKERRSSLKPYIFIPYFGAIMIIVTSVLMLTFLSNPQIISAQSLSGPQSANGVAQIEGALIAGSIFQSWIMGFVAGKMGESSMAEGFKHATMLVAISIITVYAIQFLGPSLLSF
jgi:flagellar protein FlaJ